MSHPHHRPPGTNAGILLVIPQPERRTAKLAAASAALAVTLAVTGATTARSHDAPSGWSYPFSCCSGYDCRPVTTKVVSEIQNGYVINTTGEVVPFTDTRVQSSPDGEYHWCSVAGADNGKTICLFVPQRVF